MRARGPRPGGHVRMWGEELVLYIRLWMHNQLNSAHMPKLKQEDKKGRWPEHVEELGSTCKHSEEDRWPSAETNVYVWRIFACFNDSWEIWIHWLFLGNLMNMCTLFAYNLSSSAHTQGAVIPCVPGTAREEFLLSETPNWVLEFLWPACTVSRLTY